MNDIKQSEVSIARVNFRNPWMGPPGAVSRSCHLSKPQRPHLEVGGEPFQVCLQRAWFGTGHGDDVPVEGMGPWRRFLQFLLRWEVSQPGGLPRGGVAFEAPGGSLWKQDQEEELGLWAPEWGCGELWGSQRVAGLVLGGAVGKWEDRLAGSV